MPRPEASDLPRLLGGSSPEAEAQLAEFSEPFVMALAERIVAEAAANNARVQKQFADIPSALASSFRHLPDRQKIILTLVYYERLTDADVAEVLGASRASIGAARRRALNRLRNELVHEGALLADAIDYLARDREFLVTTDDETKSNAKPERESVAGTSGAFSEERRRRRGRFAAAGLLLESRPTPTQAPSHDDFHAAEVEAGSGRPLAEFVADGRT